jgi:ubiquinone/menaquinone biosynthesis C-methylase UbiE
MSSKEQVRAGFSERAPQWAACYADTEHRTQEARNVASRQRFALQLVQAALPRGSKILDAGCGPGEVAAKLIECGYDVWGVDIAEPMIRHARIRCGSDQFRVGDIERIPFPDNMFDAVVCLGVIEYLDGDEQSLKEIGRVLKPGGWAVIATPNAICPLQIMDRALFVLLSAAKPVYYFLKYRLQGKPQPVQPPSFEGPRRRYYRGKWLRLLRSLGFEPEESLCHGWGWYKSRPLAFLVQFLGSLALWRASDRFVRNRALNWLASEQMVRARAIK